MARLIEPRTLRILPPTLFIDPRRRSLRPVGRGPLVVDVVLHQGAPQLRFAHRPPLDPQTGRAQGTALDALGSCQGNWKQREVEVR